MKPRIISGIQPTGKLHIGNYLGALKNFIDLQRTGKYDCFFFVADYHSLTEYNWKSSDEKHKQVLDVIIAFLAAGLDPRKSVLFQQSSVSAHTELAWILNTIISIGELNRMTQFKDKGKGTSSANAGLLTYPTLMAADILLYDASYVPVGEDQDQHLELTRTAARKFNARFGKTFREPKPLYTAIPRLMSLDDPTKKMSKSRPSGCIFLDDSPETVEAKVRRAVTDSGANITFNKKQKPAISNLLMLYTSITGTSISSTERRFMNASYAQFKKDLADAINKTLEPMHALRNKFEKKQRTVRKIIEKGNKSAAQHANRKLEEVKQRIGLIR